MPPLEWNGPFNASSAPNQTLLLVKKAYFAKAGLAYLTWTLLSTSEKFVTRPADLIFTAGAHPEGGVISKRYCPENQNISNNNAVVSYHRLVLRFLSWTADSNSKS